MGRNSTYTKNRYQECHYSICLCTQRWYLKTTLQWRHSGHDRVSNHQPHDCLLNHLFRRRSRKTSNLRVTGLCAGNSPGTAQMASNEENGSIWWRHHEQNGCVDKNMLLVNFRIGMTTLRARFMGPTWGPSGTDRTHVSPMWAPWTLLSGKDNTASLHPPSYSCPCYVINFKIAF